MNGDGDVTALACAECLFRRFECLKRSQAFFQKINAGGGLCVSGIVIERRAERFMHISHAYPTASGCEYFFFLVFAVPSLEQQISVPPRCVPARDTGRSTRERLDGEC